MDNPRLTGVDLNQYIQNRKSDIKTEINCIAIGTVLSFNSTEQSVTVLINYLRTIFGAVPEGSSENDQSTNKVVSYPQLVKCPLIMSQGGISYMTFPVAPGDQCVLLFNDRDIDTWWTSGSPNSAPNSTRVHDLNDALIFVGVRPQNNPIVLYNMNGPEIGNGLAKFSVEDRIKISVDSITLGATLNIIMSSLVNIANLIGDSSDAAVLAEQQVILESILI